MKRKSTKGRTKYANYLRSAHWKKTKRKILKRDERKCRRCGKKKSLNVHHLRYDNLGNEPLEDLVTLCKYCHEEVHLFPHLHPEWIDSSVAPKVIKDRDPSQWSPLEGCSKG